MTNETILTFGKGQKTISDYGDGHQVIRFDNGINKHNIRITEQDNAHIILTLIDDNGNETPNKLTLNYAFILEESAIERLEFANGDTINTADMIAASQIDDTPNNNEIDTLIIDKAANDDYNTSQAEFDLSLVPTESNQISTLSSEQI